ncbi:Nuclear pore complex protein [Schistosoma japonicum]|nr:Nuclear pore complex protein [Schistosoma japonicum]
MSANLFTYRRSHGDLLELQEVSLHHNLTNNVIRISFGGSAIISCQITETTENVLCLICTSHGAAQLVFPHPRVIATSAQHSVIGSRRNIHHTFYQIKGLQPMTIRCGTAFIQSCSGVSVFAYGLSTGSILVAKVPPLSLSVAEVSEVYELCQASMIQKIWCGITPFSGKNDSDSASSPLDIIVLNLGSDEYFLATVCKDHRLRLWDLKHRNSFIVLDLLETLPKTFDLDSFYDPSTLHSMFAPGLCHRLSSYHASEHSITLVVYLSMCLSSSPHSVSFDFTSSEEVNSSYWCWMQLDICKALSRNRECLSVLQVEPLFQSSWGNTLCGNNAELWSHESITNLPPKIKISDVNVLDFIPSQIIQKLPGRTDSYESKKTLKKPLGGVWWIAHQTNAENNDLDSNYFVRWTEIHSSDCDISKRTGTISALPPGVNFLEPVPSWYKHRSYLVPSPAENPIDDLWDETSVDVQLHIFLDQLFHPGYFSWFAITNAFKSVCESYSVLNCDSVFTTSNLHEMRVFIHHTLADKVIPNLDQDGIHTMLKTFYSTAIDYHEHGLQPLGLLRLNATVINTSPGKMLSPREDTIIVIRRWGFSILRHLQDVEILLWNNIPPTIDCIQLPYPDAKMNTQSVVDLTTDCRKILHILQEQPKWPHWKTNLFDRAKSTVNSSPLLLVEQIIEQLDQINECWLPPPITSSVKFRSPFCTGSLSSSHLTAVTCLISLLDNCDIMNESVQSLESLFGVDSNSTYEDMEITNQSWYNNSKSVGERNSLIPTNGQSVDKEITGFIEKYLSNSSVEFLRLSCYASTETRMLFAFALLILIRRNELASNGFIMLYDKNNVDNDADDYYDNVKENEVKGIDINWHINAKNRLVSLIQSLGFLRTLTVIRIKSTPDMDKLSIIRDHLNILGIHDILFPVEQFDPGIRHVTTISRPQVTISQTPGMTIFEQIWCNWDWLKLCSSKSCISCRPSSVSSWLEFNKHALSEFSRLLTPTTDGGQGIVYVLWLLLWCGHSNEVIKLCMLLLPPPTIRVGGNFTKQFDIINNQENNTWRQLFNSPENNKTDKDKELWESQHLENNEDEDSGSDRISWWWEKDFSFVHLCIGLAKLWLGESGLAKKHFIIATNWLYCYTQLFMNSLTELSVHPITSSSSPSTTIPATIIMPLVHQVPKLLIPVLFPKEFSLSKLFCLSRAPVNNSGGLHTHSLSPDEVQIRFLMKLMSIFEVSNYIPEILDLAEFCLNRLAESQNSVKLENRSEQSTRVRSSHRLASVLASLRGIMENDNAEGFLCGSLKQTNFTEDEFGDDDTQLGINARLADLEAALWTRMFKHELALGHYAKAYMILRSNPDVARRRDCLRQLITTVCDRGESSKLISFQYGPMENEFLTILETRARATDVIISDPSSIAAEKSTPSSFGSNPYYDVLYAYHIHRADYRAAASIMFEHSYRLIEDTMLAASRLNGFRSGGARILVGLQRQAACLASAINALYLVPKDNQWLVCIGPVNENVIADDNITETDSDSLDPNDDWAFANPDDLALDHHIHEEHQLLDQGEPHPTESIKRTATSDPSSLQQQIRRDKRILTLRDLLNAYILTRARLRLAQACWEQGMLRAGVFSPDEVIRGLLSVALYDEAVRLCESYNLDPTLIINSISFRCSELAQCTTTNGSFNSVHFSQPTMNKYEFCQKDNVYNIHYSTSLQNQFPVLPGLANNSSPLEYEIDLVQQSLSNLASMNFDKTGNDGYSDNSSIEKSNSSRYNLSELYWRLLETVLTRLDPPRRNEKQQSAFHAPSHGILHLIACENILTSGPNQLYLPEWLTSRLLSTGCITERAVSLLRLYLKFNRLEIAYRLAMDMLEAALGNGADPSSFGLHSTLPRSVSSSKNVFNKSTIISGTMYLPHPLFFSILNALKQLSLESKTYESMHNNLKLALQSYFVKLQSVCHGLMPSEDLNINRHFERSLLTRQNYA